MIFGLDKKKHKRNDHKTNQKISKSSKHFIYVLSKMLLWTKKEKCCFNNNYNQKTVKCLVHRKLWTYKWCALQFNDSVNSCVLYLFLVSPISVYIYIHVFHTHTAKYGFCLWIFTWFYLTCSFVFATYEMKPKKRKKNDGNIDNNESDDEWSSFQCANTSKNMDKRHLFISLVLSLASLFIALDLIYNLINKSTRQSTHY